MSSLLKKIIRFCTSSPREGHIQYLLSRIDMLKLNEIEYTKLIGKADYIIEKSPESTQREEIHKVKSNVSRMLSDVQAEIRVLNAELVLLK